MNVAAPHPEGNVAGNIFSDKRRGRGVIADGQVRLVTGFDTTKLRLEVTAEQFITIA